MERGGAGLEIPTLPGHDRYGDLFFIQGGSQVEMKKRKISNQGPQSSGKKRGVFAVDKFE